MKSNAKAGVALLAPVPEVHLRDALDLLRTKDFVAFGSDDFQTFRGLDAGIDILIYVSWSDAEPEVRYCATYRGHVEDRLEMRRLHKSGHRPSSTDGENWAAYWKVSGIRELTTPIPIHRIELPNGQHFKGVYPRGPIRVRRPDVPLEGS